MLSTASLTRSTLSRDKSTTSLRKQDVVRPPREVGSKPTSRVQKAPGSCVRKTQESAKRHGHWTQEEQRERLREERRWREEEAEEEEVFNREARVVAFGRTMEYLARHVSETEEAALTGFEEEGHSKGYAPASRPGCGFGSAILVAEPGSPPPCQRSESVTRRDDSVLKKFSQPLDFDEDYDGAESENINSDMMFEPDWDGLHKEMFPQL